jgi:hypothetical protein
VSGFFFGFRVSFRVSDFFFKFRISGSRAVLPARGFFFQFYDRKFLINYNANITMVQEVLN